MPEPGEITDVVVTLTRAQRVIRQFLRTPDGRCMCCRQANFTHAIDCEAHETFKEVGLTIALEKRARSRAPTQRLLGIVREALEFRADLFENHPHVLRLSANTLDTVDWFIRWRPRAKSAFVDCIKKGGDAPP